MHDGDTTVVIHTTSLSVCLSAHVIVWLNISLTVIAMITFRVTATFAPLRTASMYLIHCHSNTWISDIPHVALDFELLQRRVHRCIDRGKSGERPFRWKTVRLDDVKHVVYRYQPSVVCMNCMTRRHTPNTRHSLTLGIHHDDTIAKTLSRFTEWT